MFVFFSITLLVIPDNFIAVIDEIVHILDIYKKYIINIYDLMLNFIR